MKKKYVLIIFICVLLGLVVAMFNSNETLRFLFENKVWAHKVNDIEKLHKAKEKFKGVELDVVFINNDEDLFFDVNHPPDSSINLSLTEYFQSMHEAADCNYWIDFKNLKKDNELLSSARLDSITNALDIEKTKIIVESTNPSFLNSFRNKGFHTSYYLPVDLNKLDSILLKSTIDKIRKNISLYDNLYISANYQDYHILNKYFPDRKKILWFTVYGSMNKIKARILLYKILMDRNVDALLVPFN